jgi:hypothetical protein
MRSFLSDWILWLSKFNGLQAASNQTLEFYNTPYSDPFKVGIAPYV